MTQRLTRSEALVEALRAEAVFRPELPEFRCRKIRGSIYPLDLDARREA